MSADDDRAVGVVNDVVAGAAHDGASHGAQSPRAHHDHDRLLLGRSLADHLARLSPEQRHDLARDLKRDPAVVQLGDNSEVDMKWSRRTLLERIIPANFSSSCFAFCLLSSTMRSYRSTDGTSADDTEEMWQA